MRAFVRARAHKLPPTKVSKEENESIDHQNPTSTKYFRKGNTTTIYEILRFLMCFNAFLHFWGGFDPPEATYRTDSGFFKYPEY